MNCDFDEKNIKKHLKSDADIVIYDVAASTNDVAKELAAAGAKEGTAVIANKQTRGRGRLGRSFISNEENGLYMSLILRPKIPMERSVDITALASVATLSAIEKTSGKSAQIKWVNDIYINEKKVCGILTEAAYDSEAKELSYVVCGIGINIEKPKGGFPKEIEEIAGAIYEEKAPVGYKSILCANIIDTFFEYYKSILSREYMDIYKKKSNILGKEVDVYLGSQIITGIAADINEKAELIIKKSDGTLCSFNSGEARVRRSGSKLI